jgi:hypothetical protein
MQKMRRAAIMGAVLCASGAQANWAERLRVLEVVASTRSGGGAAAATTRDAAGDVSPQLCFDGATAMARICMPRLPSGNAVTGDTASWVMDRSTIGGGVKTQGRATPFRGSTLYDAPHLVSPWVLAGLTQGTDYVLACAAGHEAQAHAEMGGAGEGCRPSGDTYVGCSCGLQSKGRKRKRGDNTESYFPPSLRVLLTATGVAKLANRHYGGMAVGVAFGAIVGLRRGDGEEQVGGRLALGATPEAPVRQAWASVDEAVAATSAHASDSLKGLLLDSVASLQQYAPRVEERTRLEAKVRLSEAELQKAKRSLEAARQEIDTLRASLGTVAAGDAVSTKDLRPSLPALLFC